MYIYHTFTEHYLYGEKMHYILAIIYVFFFILGDFYLTSDVNNVIVIQKEQIVYTLFVLIEFAFQVMLLIKDEKGMLLGLRVKFCVVFFLFFKGCGFFCLRLELKGIFSLFGARTMSVYQM